MAHKHARSERRKAFDRYFMYSNGQTTVEKKRLEQALAAWQEAERQAKESE